MQTSQYIFNDTPKTNFGIHDKAFLDREDISGLAKIALLYLLGKPKHWRLRINDVKKKLGCGTSKAYKVLAELRAKGFAVMVRGQQKVEWFFYAIPKPQPAETRANSQSVRVQRVEVCDDLDSIETPERIEKQQHTPEPEPILAPETPIVVVAESIEEVPTKTLELPPTIQPEEKTAAHKILAKLDPAQIKTVLAIYSMAVAKGGVVNRLGYLSALTKAALDNTLTMPAQPETVSDRLKREHQRQQEQQQRGVMSNEQYAEWLQRTYGTTTKPSTQTPHQGVKSLKLALNIL